MTISRRDAIKLGIATAGSTLPITGIAADAAPQVGDLCSIEYEVRGNGPWNYTYEKPPEGVTHARSIGYWMGEDERHYLTAHDFARFADGRVEPVRLQHWSKSGSAVIRVIRLR